MRNAALLYTALVITALSVAAIEAQTGPKVPPPTPPPVAAQPAPAATPPTLDATTQIALHAVDEQIKDLQAQNQNINNELRAIELDVEQKFPGFELDPRDPVSGKLIARPPMPATAVPNPPGNELEAPAKSAPKKK